MQMPLNPCDTQNSAQDCIANETSIGMLRSIFGSVIDRLLSGDDPTAAEQAQEILPAMLAIFNNGLVLVGGILILLILALGTTNSANDGEVFGRNWSPTWTTLRTVFGMGMLVPSAGGYSFIQVLVLLISLWGIGLANGIHKVGIERGILSDTSTTNGVSNSGQFFGMSSFAEQYVITKYCARAANATYGERGAVPNQPNVSFDLGQPDQVRNLAQKTARVYKVRDRNAVSNLGGGNDLCGSIMFFDYQNQNMALQNEGANNVTHNLIGTQDIASSAQVNQQIGQLRNQVQVLKLAEARSLMQEIDNWVNEWPENIEADGWGNINPQRFHEIMAASDARLVGAMTQQVNQDGAGSVGSYMQNVRDFLIRGGWADAGGWFQKVGMVRSEIMQATAQPVGTITPPALEATSGSDPREQVLERSIHQAQLIMNRVHDIQETPRQNFGNLFSISMPELKDVTDISAVQTRISNQIASSSNSFMSALASSITGVGTDGTMPAYCPTTEDIGGAMNRMKCVGDMLVLGKIAMDSSILAAKTGSYAIEAIASGAKVVPLFGDAAKDGASAVMNWIRDVLLNTMEQIADKLSHVAFMFSVVLPSMPYLLFMLVVVGWTLGVLQTMVAVPLWALLHMTPERTFVGSQSQGYLLLLSLFVRPALALIGLYMGMLLSDPIINFIVRGFFAIRGVVDGNLMPGISHLVHMGTFFWWIQILSYVLLAAIYMCFTLPQMLPGTVLQWIGGGISDLGESNAVQNVRSQMVLDQRKGPYSPLRSRAPREAVGNTRKAPANPQSVAPTGSQPMINGQGTVPSGSGKKTF